MHRKIYHAILEFIYTDSPEVLASFLLFCFLFYSSRSAPHQLLYEQIMNVEKNFLARFVCVCALVWRVSLHVWRTCAALSSAAGLPDAMRKKQVNFKRFLLQNYQVIFENFIFLTFIANYTILLW